MGDFIDDFMRGDGLICSDKKCAYYVSKKKFCNCPNMKDKYRNLNGRRFDWCTGYKSKEE